MVLPSIPLPLSGFSGISATLFALIIVIAKMYRMLWLLCCCQARRTVERWNSKQQTTVCLHKYLFECSDINQWVCAVKRHKTVIIDNDLFLGTVSPTKRGVARRRPLIVHPISSSSRITCLRTVRRHRLSWVWVRVHGLRPLCASQADGLSEIRLPLWGVTWRPLETTTIPAATTWRRQSATESWGCCWQLFGAQDCPRYRTLRIHRWLRIPSERCFGNGLCGHRLYRYSFLHWTRRRKIRLSGFVFCNLISHSGRLALLCEAIRVK